MDAESAFLHAPVKCDVYVCQTPGFEKFEKNLVWNDLVWKLNKSLYGLKKRGKIWHKSLHDVLIDLCFVQSNADPCVYDKNNESGLVLF